MQKSRRESGEIMRATTTGSEAKGESERRERRRQAMIDAARALFVERGYDAVSLSEIVKRSGGSLATLYELFENKHGLLTAIVASEDFQTHERIDEVVARGGSPAKVLAEIAGIIVDGFSDPEKIGLVRIVMGESLRDQAFAEMMVRAAHQPAVERLASLFRTWHESGKAVIPDPIVTVHLFFGLVTHSSHMRALFGDSSVVTDLPARDRLIREATALFVNHYRIQDDEPA